MSRKTKRKPKRSQAALKAVVSGKTAAHAPPAPKKKAGGPGGNGNVPSDPKAHRHRRVRRHLNVRLLVGTLVAIAVLAPSLYFLHHYQLQRTAESFLTRADTLVQEEDWSQSARYIQNYLRVHPEASEQRIRLAEIYGHIAEEDPRQTFLAMTAYRQAIGAAGDSVEKVVPLRRGLCRLLLKTGQFAKAELAVLELPAIAVPELDGRHLPAAAEDKAILAQAMFGRVRIDRDLTVPFQLAWPSPRPDTWRREPWLLGEILQVAHEAAPDDIEVAIRYAIVLRDAPEMFPSETAALPSDERAKRADEAVHQAVASSKLDAQTLLRVYSYFASYASPEADRILEQALQAAPDDPAVLLTAARHSLRRRTDPISTSAPNSASEGVPVPTIAEDTPATRGDLKAAEAYYRRTIEVAPQLATAYIELGQVLHQQGKTDEAIAVWKQGDKALESPNPSLLVLLADVLLSQQQSDEADAYLRKLEEIASDANPHRIPKKDLIDLQRTLKLLHGKRYLLTNQPAPAIRQLRQVLPGLSNTARHSQMAFEAHRMLAEAYTRLQLWDMAAQSYESMAALQQGAGRVASRRAAGIAWLRAGQARLAIQQLGLVARQSGHPVDWLQLAQAILADNASRPVAERDWIGFAAAINQARRLADSAKDRAEEIRMRANLLAARGRWLQATARPGNTDLAGVRTEIEADLQKWSELYDKDEVYWAEAAGVYLALGDTDKAEQAARKARKLAPDNVNVIGLQAAIFERQGEPDRARQVILDALKSAPEERASRLRALLAQLEQNRKGQTSGDPVPDAATDPSQLTIPRLLELAEQDLARRNRRTLKWLEAIRKQEGDQGTTWKYVRGRWLMIDLADKPPKSRSDTRLLELESIVRELRRERSAWAPTYVLAGMLAQATHNIRGAIEAYRQAIELGERRVFVFEQLAKLMWTAGEEGVDDVLARLGTRVPSDPELSAISIMSAAREDDLQAAVDRAASAVKQRPKDPMAYLWYAQMLYLQKRPAAAEEQLLKATQVAPKEIRPWVALIGFYVREGRTEDAQAAAKKLEQTAEFKDDAQKNFIMAQIERQLGDTEKAAERYSAAIQLAGDDETRAAVLVKAAQVDLENDDASAAIAKLERAAKLVPASGQIRRLLAAALAARGKGDDYDRALDLLQQTDLSAGDQLSDRRLRGLLLARRSDIAYRSNVAEAQNVYEELVAEKENPADRAFLASLCMVRACLEPPDGQSREETEKLRQELIERADAEYRAAIAVNPPNAEHIVQYLGFLQLNGRREEASALLPRLRTALVGQQSDRPRVVARYGRVLVDLGFRDEAQPVADEVSRRLTELGDRARSDDWRRAAELYLKLDRHDLAIAAIRQLEQQDALSVAALELKVRWMKATGMGDVAQVLDEFAKRYLSDPDRARKKAVLYQQLALICGRNALYVEAETWARKLVEMVPTGYPMLVTSLVKQDRFDEALMACRAAIGKDSVSRIAAMMAQILIQQERIPAEQLVEVNEVVRQAMDEAPDDPALLTAVGTLRAKQQRVAEAVELYRKVLEQQPRNVLVLNNLATLLAETPGRSDEALRYADYAMMYAGANGALLDTKGTALLRAKRYEDAVRLLEMAIRSPAADEDPRIAFHLAVALSHVGNHDKAKKHFDEALAAGLETQLLTPADRADVERMKQER